MTSKGVDGKFGAKLKIENFNIDDIDLESQEEIYKIICEQSEERKYQEIVNPSKPLPEVNNKEQQDVNDLLLSSLPTIKSNTNNFK